MKKRIFFLLGLGIILLFFIPISATTLSSSKKLIAILPVSLHDSFSMRWTHSVEKEDWEEFFKVKDDHIILDSTRFKTFGAGVPDDAGNDTFIKDGWVYMTGIHRDMGKEIIYQTGKTTNHRFIVDEKTCSLDPQETYTIKLESIPIYKIACYFLINLRGEST